MTPLRLRMIEDMRLAGYSATTQRCYFSEVARLADAGRLAAQIALFVFRVVDSIMASHQLLGIRNRVEYCKADHASPRDPETGAHNQYQTYEVLYATGERAGIAGNGDGARWRQSAIEDGILGEGV